MAALDMVICPTQYSRFPMELFPALSCAIEAKKYDWCGLVLDRLMASATRFQLRFNVVVGFVRGCGGCTLFLVRNPIQWDVRPRLKVWTDVQIRKACIKDRMTDGGDFGHVGVLDIAYGEHHPYDARDLEPPSDDDDVP